MTRLVNEKFKIFIMTSFFFISSFAYAEDVEPYDVIKSTVDELLLSLNSIEKNGENNDQYYRAIVEDILFSVVDFETTAKLVMGKTYYLSASESERLRFNHVFKEELISTYSTGLSLFDGESVEVLRPSKPEPDKNITSVSLIVRTNEGPEFPMTFTLRKKPEDSWKIVNVILNGYNVGKAYNQRFMDSMKKYEGNFDQLIASWQSNTAQENIDTAENQLIAGWKKIVFEGETNYTKSQECLAAESSGTASGFAKEHRLNVDENTYLKWAWKADSLMDGNIFSERSRQGDDFLARVFVIHEGNFPWQTKALNYVWSSKEPIGAYWQNPFVQNAVMVVVQNGEENLSSFSSFERNIKEDFKTYFDMDIDKIDGVAFMTDTDNSGGYAKACYVVPEIINKV
jgi:ABC-type transporter MlaC component